MIELADLPEDLKEVAIREIGKVAPEKVAHLQGGQP